MNIDFQPDLTLATRASTIWLTQRMMSSRISTARLCRMTTTKGRRKSFWGEGRRGSRAGARAGGQACLGGRRAPRSARHSASSCLSAHAAHSP